MSTAPENDLTPNFADGHAASSEASSSNEGVADPATSQRDGQMNGQADDRMTDGSTVQRSGGALPSGAMSEDLFEALDDISEVVVALRSEAAHTEKAAQLDEAGKRIIDTLVREFSLKSAQVEVLLRRSESIDEAWGDYAQKVARRNEHLDGSEAVA
jgi:hypothetical protein